MRPPGGTNARCEKSWISSQMTSGKRICQNSEPWVEQSATITAPLAATVATRKVFDAFWSDDPKKALMHGPTFMANALACAAANASLDLFGSEPRMQQVADISSALLQGLEPCRGLPGVKNVRVKGAIGVVEMDDVGDLNALRAAFINEGVFVRPFGNVIYLTPAFTISADELKILTDAVLKVVRTNKHRERS